ncbi:hypothetical protein [uncultured Aquimarina sp.]|uniref:hypothetical protein n=1 Tax=uncultured Aquimarina sp. TaxID=575652 RepID=UPI00260F1D2D|nr:hypothetical protein [uncultured Aquimarina sp.]
MKAKFLTLVVALFIGAVSYAGCTVTTDCGIFEFPNETSVSVSTQSAPEGVLITVRGANGNVLLRRTCSSGSVSSNCSSGGGDVDICDILPPFLADLYGCND